MTTIHIQANDQNLTITECPVLTAGNIDSVVVHIDFSDEWTGFEKTAVFYQDEKNVYHVVVNGVDECVVPWEVLQSPGVLSFGVFGCRGGAIKTSEVITLHIKRGSYGEGTATSDPTPDIYSQIMSEIALRGYYIPQVSQTDENTMRISYSPSVENMPAVSDKNITLPHGKDAVSPVVSISDITGGHRVTITDINGKKTVDIMNGNDGNDGADGKEGNGISSAVLNSDYTLTLTFKNGTSYTTPSIRGATGNTGKDGKDGTNGDDGGYYIPVATPVSTTSVRFSYTPSKESMPSIESQVVTLPTNDTTGDENVDTQGAVIKVAGIVIRYGTEYADVIDLPCNQIFSIHADVDPTSFGLPAKGHGTLLKYRPYLDSATDVGHVVYEYTVCCSEASLWYDKYFAYASAGTTKDTIIWNKYNKAAVVPGIQKLGLEDKSIVFIGDSILEGYGASDYNGGETGTSGHLIENNIKTWYRNTGSNCWTNKMISYLTEHYPGVTACNNGIGGINITNVYENLETLTLDDSGNRADVVVLAIGTNSRRWEDKYTSITFGIRRIITWLLIHNIQPIVLTNTPLIAGDDTNNVDNEKNLRCVRSAIMQACEESGVLCYDILSEFYHYLWDHNIELSTSTVMADLLHPNDTGYDIMFHLLKKLFHV